MGRAAGERAQLGAQLGLGVGQEVDPARQQGVGDRHGLAVHLLGRLGNADRVVERLGHLLAAIGPLEQREGQHDLGRLPVGALDLAGEQQVEGLIGAADLDVGLERHGVVALDQGKEELVDRD